MYVFKTDRKVKIFHFLYVQDKSWLSSKKLMLDSVLTLVQINTLVFLLLILAAVKYANHGLGLAPT